MKYPIAIECGDEATAWGAVVPDLPGCFSAGDSLDEAYANAEKAVAFWIGEALDRGEPVPTPKSLDEHFNGKRFERWLWAIISVEDV
ncbi:type II toxin-antitoxin system HicB family antitoxin [Dyella jejuensis]|uniref:Type II toxin-antitoxin system HicB family antitoxin n=1 Tax=Dyella jejuensis TaxID=1432009 RepID=A0ABW8JET0_9GAMM